MRFKYILISFVLFIISGSVDARLKLVFRYDDFTLQQDKINEEVVNVFRRNNIPLVIGIIPADSNETFIFQKNYGFLQVLKKNIKSGSIEIALHGLTHQKIVNGEFDKLNIVEQNRRIQRGKSFLDSIFKTNIKTFIPPYNSYDDNTLKVLNSNGFTIISSALCIGQSFLNNRLEYVPETLEGFNELLSVLGKNRNRNGIVVVMFHDYTFNNKFNIKDLDNLLKSINTLNFVKCSTFSELNGITEKLDETRMKANMESNLLSKKLHLSGVIQTTGFAIMIRIINLFGYLLLSILSYIVTYLIFSKNKKTNIYGQIFSILITVVPTGILVWFHIFSPIKLVVLAVTLSVIISILSKLKYKINK